jgi:hypothetical protein
VKKYLLIPLTVMMFVIFGGSAKAVPSPPMQIDDGACYSLTYDCGYAGFSSGSGQFFDSTNTYDSNAGRCRYKYGEAHRNNHFGVRMWTYYQQVHYCWRNGVITRFHRDRWTGSTFLGWSFDGNIAGNCNLEGCDGKTGTYSSNAWTQGKYHVGFTVAGFGYVVNKYPQINITVYADGSAIAGWCCA